jgi:protein TonB
MRFFAYIGLALIPLATTHAQAAGNTDAQPADRPMPDYPATAMNLEGHVTIHFGVSANGNTQNLQVTRSDPPGLFDQAALSAVSRWLYRPRIRNGHPVARSISPSSHPTRNRFSNQRSPIPAKHTPRTRKVRSPSPSTSHRVA